ncbi:MAG TPA: tRNA pseudouridine(38-40) synthase TruA [Thermoanaerobaculia bacterium]|nr:tRNA pseudouridine(38-40) synthase TruA [Thermoanaerobaculia bacterium]
MRILLTIQYLGTRYAGWQTQSNAVGVQQVIEAALTRLCAEPIRIEGAGRTDAGVHALAQRAHFDIPISITSRGLILGLNDLLPHDIRVTGAETVGDDFHCRFAATGKRYVYRIWNGPIADVFHWATHAHVAQPLEIEPMAEAASMLAGEHDFRAFTVANPTVSSTRRALRSLEVERRGDAISIALAADGFLRFMARRIAGSLIEAGSRRISPSRVAESLEPAFSAARWTAPPRGLTLVEVEYDPTLPSQPE